MEEMHQILPLSSLGAIAGYQDKALWHNPAEGFSHFRVSGAHHGSDIAVGTAHMLFTPSGHLLAHNFVKGPVPKGNPPCTSGLCPCSHHPVLKFPTAGVGGFHQDKQPFLFLLAHLDKRLYPVRAQVRIDRCKILVKAVMVSAPHLHFAKMPCRISFRR